MKKRLEFVVHAQRKRDSVSHGGYTIAYWQTYLKSPGKSREMFWVDSYREVPKAIAETSDIIATRLLRFRINPFPI